MNYPFWDIPHLGSGWVIGMIAIFHVMISQFAVGGGFYLPLAERKAMGMADQKMAPNGSNSLPATPSSSSFSPPYLAPSPAWASGLPSALRILRPPAL